MVAPSVLSALVLWIGVAGSVHGKVELHQSYGAVVDRPDVVNHGQQSTEGIHFDAGRTLNPVVLVPGFMGSRLQAKLNGHNKVPNDKCKTDSDWFDIWVDPLQLLPKKIDCLFSYMEMVYEPTTGEFENAEGVAIRVPDFGYTSSIVSIIKWLPRQTNAYKTILNALSKLGYEWDVTIKAATFDFRRAPHDRFFRDTQVLIEDVVEDQGAPVVLISHSYGCLYTAAFLEAMEPEWQKKYIKVWMPVAGPFAGTGVEETLFLSGIGWDLPWAPKGSIRNLQRSFEANLFMLPSTLGYGDTPIVQTPDRNFTASDDDIRELIKLSGASEYLKAFDRIRKDSSALQTDHTNVSIPVRCVTGGGIKTVYGSVYNSTDLSSNSTTVTKHLYTDGDGTLTDGSTGACEQIYGHLASFELINVDDASHLGIFDKEEFKLRALLPALGITSLPPQLMELLLAPDALQEDLDALRYPDA
eukprot:Clim_evm18s9 gene=Clim_evmTU18s9